MIVELKINLGSKGCSLEYVMFRDDTDWGESTMSDFLMNPEAWSFAPKKQ